MKTLGAVHTTKAMVEDQGIDTLDDLCFLKDGDVETLCKNVKCPGGTAGGNNRGANLGPNAPMINERDWPKTFDGIDEFLHKCYWITSSSLAYIIRKDSTPKEGEDTDWDDPLKRMIERAPHTITEANGTIIKHPTFVTDNKMPFDKLAELTREHECWTYIQASCMSQKWKGSLHGFH